MLKSLTSLQVVVLKLVVALVDVRLLLGSAALRDVVHSLVACISEGDTTVRQKSRMRGALVKSGWPGSIGVRKDKSQVVLIGAA